MKTRLVSVPCAVCRKVSPLADLTDRLDHLRQENRELRSRVADLQQRLRQMTLPRGVQVRARVGERADVECAAGG